MRGPFIVRAYNTIIYLYDFLFMGASDTEEASRALAVALCVLEHLGVPVAVHKTEGPAYCITFLGLLIDTNAFELRLLVGKIQCLQTLLQSWSSKKSCTRKELESRLGHLSHVASIVRPGHQTFQPLKVFMRVICSWITV